MVLVICRVIIFDQVEVFFFFFFADGHCWLYQKGLYSNEYCRKSAEQRDDGNAEWDGEDAEELRKELEIVAGGLVEEEEERPSSHRNTSVPFSENAGVG